MLKFSEIQPYLYYSGIQDTKYHLNFIKNGDVSFGYKLDLKEINTLTEIEIQNINSNFRKAFISLPYGSVVHKQDYFFLTKHKGTDLERQNFLYNEHEKYFYEREFLKHDSYLYFSCMANGYMDRNSSKTILLGNKGNIVSTEKLEVFFNAVEKFEYILKNSGIGITPLNRKENTKLKYKYFSLTEENCVLGDISFEDDLVVGNKKVDIYSINDAMDLPENVEEVSKIKELSTEKSEMFGSFFYPLGFKLQCDHIINTVLQRVDEEKVIEKVNNKIRIKGAKRLSNYNYKVFEANQGLINEKLDAGINICKAHVNLMVVSEDDNERKKNKNEAESALDEIGITPVNNRLRLGNLFWGSAPFCAGDISNDVLYVTNIYVASVMNNWETNYKSAIDGVIFYDRFNQRPIILDMWDKPYKDKIISNRNCFMIGPSGQGKSVALNHIFSQYLEQEYYLVILDIGDSYKKLCELYGGLYYKYDRNKPLFNPFIVKNNKPDGDFIESLAELLATAWKLKTSILTSEEEAVIKQSIILYYEYLRKNKIEKASFDSYYEFYETNCADKDRKYNKENTVFDVDSYMLVLKSFRSGEMYGNVFNGEETIDILKDNFIVFELDNIKDNKVLFPIVSHVVTHTINNTIFKRPGTKKAIWIDEAWKVIENSEMALFVKYLYKTVRKKQGQVGIAVQDITDLPENEIGSTIINNSAIKILLPHKDNKEIIPVVSKKLSLTIQGERLLYSLESDLNKGYTENLIVMGNLTKAYRLELSKSSYYAFTSEEDENVEIYKHFEKEGSMRNAIQRTIEDNAKK